MHMSLLSVVLLIMISKVYSNKINFDMQDPNHFGRYNLNFTRFELCSGLKSKNLTKIDIALIPDKNTSYGHYNFTFLGPTLLEEVKIVVYSMKNGKINSVLWTYKLKDPCKHYALAAGINAYLKASRNCVVSKGTYVWDKRVEELYEPFFGTSFFYGEYLLKAQVLSKKGNVLCMYVGLWFTKKSGSKT
ncbi:uncharacterized protein LOC112044330 [Bicyclus anynana]|uniref:Uncharacterized protein LOC112044330 n=1 Tax=Bicyclus anynana TaxID=110368 RepID=A0A6J1MSM5_BICAN|nr:uncharacterized protein LOC112044330 [Bicyclus anynana]